MSNAEKVTYKSARVARRKMIRLGNQVLRSSRRLNARHNDGQSNATAVRVLARLRRYHLSRFNSLVSETGVRHA